MGGTYPTQWFSQFNNSVRGTHVAPIKCANVYVAPIVAPIFFASSRPVADLLPVGPLKYEEINQRLHGPGNGLLDIYWVSTEAIQLP